MATTTRDVESQFDGIDGFDPSDPLLPQPGGISPRSARKMRRSLEVIELDDIPPIIKSANGNIFWADEQCTRRVGLTSTEARLFLKLLQTDEPENLNYDEYKSMFDDFGREQRRLQELVNALPWYNIDSWGQRAIWEARIQWLRRMEEPRLWLLYLMARRKRILKTASTRILVRLKEKRRARMVAQESPSRGRDTQPVSPVGQPIMLNDTTQTSQSLIETTVPILPPKPRNTAMIDEVSQTSSSHLNLAERIRDSLSLSPLGKREHSRNSSKGRCPVFSERWEATRGDIKKQVENIMGEQPSYIVVGWFLRSALHPQEKILQFENPEELFVALRKGERSLRGWRRFFSLKGLRGFGLYKCDISRGAHIPLALNASQEAVLAQLFLAYRASRRHADADVARAWQGWVQKNLNDSKRNPLEGRYSLQLKYEWSSYRLTTIVAIPLLLSLAIGFWYMSVGDVVTAWTLALYIVTAAAALIALMTIVGSLKDI